MFESSRIIVFFRSFAKVKASKLWSFLISAAKLDGQDFPLMK